MNVLQSRDQRRKRDDKPHLWRIAKYSERHEFWQCVGNGVGGHGGTPSEAYGHWRFAEAIQGMNK